MTRRVPAAARPCPECPWRLDVEPGKFEAERYECLRNTSGTRGAEASFTDPWFACHRSPEGREHACAGWLAAAGADHLGVRLAVASGQLDGEALWPKPGWPELHRTYDEMAAAKALRPEPQEEP